MFSVVRAWSSNGLPIQKSNLEKLKQDFFDTKNLLVNGEEKQRDILAKIFQINKRLKSLVNEKTKLEQKKMQLEASTKETASQVVEMREKIKQQQFLLQKRLQALSRLSKTGPGELLLSAKTPAALDRNLKILGIISKYDLALISGYTQMHQSLQTKQNQFVARLEKLKKSQSELKKQEGKIQVDVNSKLKILAASRSGKEIVLKKLRALRNKLQMQPDFEHDEFVDLMLQPSFDEIKGQVNHPVTGQIVRRFGIYKDAEFNVSINHKGLLYHLNQSQDIQNIFPGQIVWSQEIPGLGETVIVDHGDHYYSVYSGKLTNLPSIGTTLQKGQKIATANDSLYFEVRHFSEPSDPLRWMKGHNQ